MSDTRILTESTGPPSRYDPSDASIPRASVVKKFKAYPGSCPHCGAQVYQHSHTYLVSTRRGDELGDTFVLGGDFGWFCPGCPTIVLDRLKVEEILQSALFRWDTGDRYIVRGLVDTDAIPEDKRDLPLGDDDNPIPFVEFTNLGLSRRKPSHRSRAAKKAKAKRKQQKKARRRSRRR